MQAVQIEALVKRYEYADWKTERLAGIVASVVANFSMARPKEALSPADFMPSQWNKKPIVPATKMRNKQVVASEIRSTMSAWIKDPPNE